MGARILLALTLVLLAPSAAALVDPILLSPSDPLEAPAGKLLALALPLAPWAGPLPAPVPGKVPTMSLHALPAG